MNTDWAKVVFRQLRPKQWAKNFLCFVPLLFSGKLTHAHADWSALMCFVSFCATSSCVYTINDLMDKSRDQLHPQKKLRPVASGALSKTQAVGLAYACGVLGYSLSFCIRPSASIILVAYFLLNLAYSFSWKRFAIIDVLCVSLGFLLRAVAGAVAVNVEPSEWFLLCTTLGALFLALEKRRYELRSFAEDIGQHRVALSQYSMALLTRMENLVLPGLVVCYAFYSFLSFHGKFMVLTFPFLLYGIMRYQHLSEDGQMTGAPEDVFWTDLPIRYALIGWLAMSVLVVYGDLASWTHFIQSRVDAFSVQRF